MIGGVNPNSNLTFQSGNNSPARERSDVGRAPASTAEDNTRQVRRGLAEATAETNESRPTPPSDAIERRIEARKAADDVRLERFRADEIPLNTSRALSTFADVAARDESVDSVLTGIDIRV